MGHDGVEARIVLDLWGLGCVACGYEKTLVYRPICSFDRPAGIDSCIFSSDAGDVLV